jgi:phospholipid/cholesterol/gamma-HCH transport system substrate-binding protein
VRRWLGRRSNFQIGAAVLLVSAAALSVLFEREIVELKLRPGERIAADFTARPTAEAIRSKVKVAGLKVGKVESMKELPDGKTRVIMKVAEGTRAKLGTEPSAAARTLLLFSGPGRAAYIDLRPGGAPGEFKGVIPPERASLPVELYQVLAALQPQVRESLSNTVQHLDASLAGGGADALRSLVEAAPAPLQALTPVAQGLRGEQNGDLTRVVQHLSRAGQILTEDDGTQLAAVVDSLQTVAARLGQRSADLTAAVDRLPPTLAEAKTTLAKLNGTLDRLDRAAPALMPSIPVLRSTVAAAGPVVAEARPVIAGLRPLVGQLRPVLRDAVPTVRSGTQVLGDIEGPVVDRLNQSVIPRLYGHYGDSPSALYEELGYTVAGLDGVLKYIDDGGGMLRAYVAVDQDGSALSKGSPPPRKPRSAVDAAWASGRLPLTSTWRVP